MTPSPLDSYRFAANSRYRDAAILTTTSADGQAVRYLDRRLLPDPSAMVALRRRVVTDGDRLDVIAAAEIGDAELWWRVADANRAMNPVDLLAAPGRRLLIPMPLGMPGGGGV
ncbi:LysM domain-containing protein [Sphingomonas sp.]|uniref:LysM domain-containing protein n=1 Tax=Sphingomonas sp. TaxID=28214 RepID=UPI0035BC4E52